MSNCAKDDMFLMDQVEKNSSITETCHELFESVSFEMQSNAEIIDYHLTHFGAVEESFINNFRNRMMSIVNAIDNSRHSLLI